METVINSDQTRSNSFYSDNNTYIMLADCTLTVYFSAAAYIYCTQSKTASIRYSNIFNGILIFYFLFF